MRINYSTGEMVRSNSFRTALSFDLQGKGTRNQILGTAVENWLGSNNMATFEQLADFVNGLLSTGNAIHGDSLRLALVNINDLEEEGLEILGLVYKDSSIAAAVICSQEEDDYYAPAGGGGKKGIQV